MGAVKLSISVDEEQARWLRREARRQKRTVSALLSEATADMRRRQAMRRVVELTGGPIELTADDIADIRREWSAG